MKVLILVLTVVVSAYCAPQITIPTVPTLPPPELLTLVYLGGPCQRLGEKRLTLQILDIPVQVCECKAHPWLYGTIFQWTDCVEAPKSTTSTTTTTASPSSSSSTTTQSP